MSKSSEVLAIGAMGALALIGAAAHASEPTSARQKQVAGQGHSQTQSSRTRGLKYGDIVLKKGVATQPQTRARAEQTRAAPRGYQIVSAGADEGAQKGQRDTIDILSISKPVNGRTAPAETLDITHAGILDEPAAGEIAMEAITIVHEGFEIQSTFNPKELAVDKHVPWVRVAQPHGGAASDDHVSNNDPIQE